MFVSAGTTLFLANVTLQAGSTFSGSGTLHMNGSTTISDRTTWQTSGSTTDCTRCFPPFAG